MGKDRSYMERAIQLAKNALGTTYPNPMVGCVIVHDDKIIGEGFTSPYGGNHAEVNAINSVTDKSLLSKATLYVSLEPCSHFGKTPPCADLIIEYKIPRVVIGIGDPHKKVAGKGIQKLRDAGCTVKIGVLGDECGEHHRRFLTFHEKKRPYVILKWAETLNGCIAPNAALRKETPMPYWITNRKSRQLVHKWRSEEHAILVGTNTVLKDNPKLNVRDWEGKAPIRIILDRDLKIPTDCHVLDGSVPTFVLTEKLPPLKRRENVHYQELDFENDVAKGICEILFKENIISLIVEGGARTLQTFIDAHLWDEALVFRGAVSFTDGLEAPRFSAKPINEQKILNDTLIRYRNDP